MIACFSLFRVLILCYERNSSRFGMLHRVMGSWESTQKSRPRNFGHVYSLRRLANIEMFSVTSCVERGVVVAVSLVLNSKPVHHLCFGYKIKIQKSKKVTLTKDNDNIVLLVNHYLLSKSW